jgi:ATP-dependent helicase/nuclease subunit B
LREAIDDGTPESRERKAALITPDRALARRVLAALERWNVPVDDSGGDPLADTLAGVFSRLAAQVALGGSSRWHCSACSSIRCASSDATTEPLCGD